MKCVLKALKDCVLGLANFGIKVIELQGTRDQYPIWVREQQPGNPHRETTFFETEVSITFSI